VTLPFIDKRWFLTVTQLVLTLLLPLHEVAAHPAAAEPLHAAADLLLQSLLLTLLLVLLL
jgi:hypothetical protein